VKTGHSSDRPGSARQRALPRMSRLGQRPAIPVASRHNVRSCGSSDASSIHSILENLNSGDVTASEQSAAGDDVHGGLVHNSSPAPGHVQQHRDHHRDAKGESWSKGDIDFDVEIDVAHSKHPSSKSSSIDGQDFNPGENSVPAKMTPMDRKMGSSSVASHNKPEKRRMPDATADCVDGLQQPSMELVGSMNSIRTPEDFLDRDMGLHVQQLSGDSHPGWTQVQGTRALHRRGIHASDKSHAISINDSGSLPEPISSPMGKKRNDSTLPGLLSTGYTPNPDHKPESFHLGPDESDKLSIPYSSISKAADRERTMVLGTSQSESNSSTSRNSGSKDAETRAQRLLAEGMGLHQADSDVISRSNRLSGQKQVHAFCRSDQLEQEPSEMHLSPAGGGEANAVASAKRNVQSFPNTMTSEFNSGEGSSGSKPNQAADSERMEGSNRDQSCNNLSENITCPFPVGESKAPKVSTRVASKPGGAFLPPSRMRSQSMSDMGTKAIQVHPCSGNAARDPEVSSFTVPRSAQPTQMTFFGDRERDEVDEKQCDFYAPSLSQNNESSAGSSKMVESQSIFTAPAGERIRHGLSHASEE